MGGSQLTSPVAGQAKKDVWVYTIGKGDDLKSGRIIVLLCTPADQPASPRNWNPMLHLRRLEIWWVLRLSVFEEHRRHRGCLSEQMEDPTSMRSGAIRFP